MRNGKTPFVKRVQAQLPKILELPIETKLWILRKYYAGNSGCLPPNDPRIMALTEDQIELELAFIERERKLVKGYGKEHFEDPEYDEFEKEIEEVDSQLSYEYEFPAEETDRTSEVEHHAVSEDDWVDVETDDYED